MKKDEEQMEMLHNNRLFKRSLIIGFIGGLLWSLFLAGTYYFNFSEIAPKTYLLKPWIQAGWVDRLYGHIISCLIAAIISLILAIVYYVLFRKLNSMWMGVGYGAVLWGIIFFLLQPILPNTKPMINLETETWVTTLCVFILYGLFVGFSISYDYHEMELRMAERKSESPS